MSLVTLSVVFISVLVASVGVLTIWIRRKTLGATVESPRAPKSPVAGFTADVLKYRWLVIFIGALLVAAERLFHFSGGWLQSKVVLGIAVAAIFAAREVARRNRAKSFLGTGFEMSRGD